MRQREQRGLVESRKGRARTSKKQQTREQGERTCAMVTGQAQEGQPIAKMAGDRDTARDRGQAQTLDSVFRVSAGSAPLIHSRLGIL